MGHLCYIGGTWRDCNISLILTCLIQCKALLSSKTAIAAANVEVIGTYIATMRVMNGYSSQTEVYRGA